ncbi:hypothetical protein [Hafnia alvei]|uniref:Uncharacterized protein n=1 Tax=Hafnia alvei TaxID=569 RepID=A0A1C6Z504_HAFAL|nr:hypothetical protein [Hafnia alvei]NLS56381.1 hypothetical protein [Hafnia alvei]SCM54250.1 hypothetical protein BN1044_03750 [Hafnia alvei]
MNWLTKLIPNAILILLTGFSSAYFSNYISQQNLLQDKLDKKIDIAVSLESAITICDYKAEQYISSIKNEIFYYEQGDMTPQSKRIKNTDNSRQLYDHCINLAKESIVENKVLLGNDFSGRMYQCIGFIKMKVNNYSDTLNTLRDSKINTLTNYDKDLRDKTQTAIEKYITYCLPEKSSLESYIYTSGRLPGAITLQN